MRISLVFTFVLLPMAVGAKKASKKSKKNDDGGTSSPPVDAEIDRWFGPWWKKRASLVPMFQKTITDFRPVQIRNFLSNKYALALHAEMFDSAAWSDTSGYKRIYQYHHRRLEADEGHPYLKRLTEIMERAEVKGFIYDISQSDVNGTSSSSATYYKVGDYMMPHTDQNLEGNRRRIAFNLHMTKSWNPKFGGDLVRFSERAA